uniref:Guanine nucleotide-binding protein subunit alpha n=1 Tax=Hirondellea gigas TaxID=1518452 RepID=A0A6A7G3I8_9CRUS
MLMGCCSSSQPDDERKRREKRSKQIESHLSKDRARNQRICKLLFLGSGESGKSTFFRQMRICHGPGFRKEELENFIPIVHSNTIGCMTTLIRMSQRLPGCAFAKELQPQADIFLDLEEGSDVTPEVASIVEAFWKDEGIQKTWTQRAKFQIFDSAAYFFARVHNFENRDYVPTVVDVLRCRIRTSGIVEETFKIEEATFHVFDVGGQRNERKKWMHCFENVTAVAFVASISEFDQVLIEDGETNRLIESLNVFEGVMQNKWFDETAIILFLNKKDLLLEKLGAGVRLADSFPAYKGDNSFDSCCDFIRKEFISRTGGTKIYVHITCATDETPQLKKLFASVKNIVVEASLKDGGFF